MTPRHLPRRLLAGVLAVTALFLPAWTRTASSVALPSVSGCGLPGGTARCPSVLRRSPDVATYGKSLVADPRRHRIYTVGVDAGGWESLLAVDTRTRRQLVQRSSAATAFPETSAKGVNSLAAVLTPDGRTVLSAGYVFRSEGLNAAVVALDTSTGRIRWAWVSPHQGTDDTFQSLVVDPQGRHVFAVGREAEHPLGSYRDQAVIRSFDVDSGRQLWQVRVNPPGATDRWFASVDYVGNRVVAVGSALFSDGNIDQLAATVDPRAGRLIRMRTFDDGGDEYGDASAVLTNGNVVMTGAHTTRNVAFDVTADGLWDVDTRALDPLTLAPRWHEKTTGGTGLGLDVAAVGNQVVVGYNSPSADLDPAGYLSLPGPYCSVGGRPGLLVLDAPTGREVRRWTDVLPAADATFYFSTLRVTATTAYFVGEGGPADGLFYYALPTGAAEVAIANNGIVAAVSLSTGAVRWTSDYNDDPRGLDRSEFSDAALTPDGLFVAGSLDTRSQLPQGGVVDGTLLRYDA
jgi:hypothetical protein